jgi:hypothetical protein
MDPLSQDAVNQYLADRERLQRENAELRARVEELEHAIKIAVAKPPNERVQTLRAALAPTTLEESCRWCGGSGGRHWHSGSCVPCKGTGRAPKGGETP